MLMSVGDSRTPLAWAYTGAGGIPSWLAIFHVMLSFQFWQDTGTRTQRLFFCLVAILLARRQSRRARGPYQPSCPGHLRFPERFWEVSAQPAWDANSRAAHWHVVFQNSLISPPFSTQKMFQPLVITQNCLFFFFSLL